jgi:uncharacterized membrane protein
MFFLPFSIIIFILFILLLPVIFLLISADVVGFAFAKLGMSPQLGVAFFLLSLIGSTINIPVRQKILRDFQTLEISPLHRFLFGIQPEFFQKQVLAVNVGGCILPLILTIFLVLRAPTVPLIVCTAIMILVCKFLAHPTPGIGIAIPAFLPPLFSALLALLFAGRENAPPVAYVSGVLGVLIGADLLNIKVLEKTGHGIMSIGGAGVFDGIFLVGILAVLIA